MPDVTQHPVPRQRRGAHPSAAPVTARAADRDIRRRDPLGPMTSPPLGGFNSWL